MLRAFQDVRGHNSVACETELAEMKAGNRLWLAPSPSTANHEVNLASSILHSTETVGFVQKYLPTKTVRESNLPALIMFLVTAGNEK